MEAWARVSGRLRREGGACGEGRRWPRPKCSGVDGENAGVDRESAGVDGVAGDGTGVEGAVRKPLSVGAEAGVFSVIGEESKDGQSRKWRGVEVLRLMGNTKQRKKRKAMVVGTWHKGKVYLRVKKS
jgi:hypothetical protein